MKTTYLVHPQFAEGRTIPVNAANGVAESGGKSITIRRGDKHHQEFIATIDGEEIPVIAKSDSSGNVTLTVCGYVYQFRVREQRMEKYEQILLSSDAMKQASVKVAAPMPGLLKHIHVSDGQHVKRGENVFVLEAMKMENLIKAPAPGIIRKLSINEGTAVEKGTVLCIIEQE